MPVTPARLVALLSTTSLLTLFTLTGDRAPSALAQTALPRQPPGAVDLTRIPFTSLRPDPKSEIELPVMEINLTSDGTLRIHQMHRTRARAGKIEYAWHVDLRTMTYRTFRITGDSDRERVRAYLQEKEREPPLTPEELTRVAGVPVQRELSAQRQPADVGASLRALVKRRIGPIATLPKTSDGPCNCCPTCECGGWWDVQADTLDPPNYLLTRSLTGLRWQSTFSFPDDNRCWMEAFAWPIDGSVCQSFTTPIGTHWYTAACQITQEDFNHDDRFGYAQTHAIYYNTDFPPSFGETVYVDQIVYVWVNGNEVGEGDSHAYSGAWTASLLHGTIAAFGINSCQM